MIDSINLILYICTINKFTKNIDPILKKQRKK